MGKLVPNYKTNKFDFVDDKGQRTPSVGNLLSPVEIVKFLDVDAKTLITLETIESGKPRQFTMEANTLSRQESFGSTLFNNSYFINFKLINPLRQYVTLGIQHLQTSGKVKYKHKSLGFFTQEDDTSVFLLSKTMTLHGSSTYYDEKFQFISGTFKDYELFLKSEILPHVETQLALTIGLSSVVASYLKDFADVFQIGSRNAYNTDLLRETNRYDKPILYKRHYSMGLQEFVNHAGYMTNDVTMCLRGDLSLHLQEQRFRSDMADIQRLRELTENKICYDVSHSSCEARFVEQNTFAAMAYRPDMIMIETHPEPPKALSDSAQQLDFEQFRILVGKIRQGER